MNKTKIKQIAVCAIFTAIIAATAWISLPTPFGINLSLQLFGVCLTGFVLGVKRSLASTGVYIALGAVGLPVFSQFSGGFGVLLGVSGGFLWGFLATSVLCGFMKNLSKPLAKYSLMVLSVAVCHAAGTIQYSAITGNGLWVSFLSASLPFLVKDLLLVFVANVVSKKIKT